MIDIVAVAVLFLVKCYFGIETDNLIISSVAIGAVNVRCTIVPYRGVLALSYLVSWPANLAFLPDSIAP